ncbi:(2Fe-2S) ferredoxin domain-containing protein [Halorubrum rutilum]|uniref:(2Fe-2S) ferredoxin domain-containing protein n=1 Tax=Halorubrum rutilum TaxID=1364933 RepID=A0ABD6AI10_9EURY
MERRTERMRERGLAATVLVCTNERAEHAACAAADGAAVADAARDWLRERDRYWSEVAVAETSCLGLCSEAGAAVVVHPRDEWFAAVTPGDVPALMAQLFESGADDGDADDEDTEDAAAEETVPDDAADATDPATIG